jgi:hypothetical protein
VSHSLVNRAAIFLGSRNCFYTHTSHNRIKMGY